jgi:outer membrane receptor protein involved in Fe transport
MTKKSHTSFTKNSVNIAIQTVIQTCVFAAFVSSSAIAQTNSSTNSNSNTSTEVSASDTVVVTGRAGSGLRTKINTSYSITTIDEEALRLQAPTSVTEAMKSVPGFWVEASGGEASGNIRARGIPVDGFGSVNILEDGVPIQHDPALGYLNGDQAFRLDETIYRIEVVRGGPSSILYSNAPAGAINFRTREIGDKPAGTIKQTIGDYGLSRTDFWFSSPLSDGWSASLGGFFRTSDGVRNPGFGPEHGGQLRLRLVKEIEQGKITIDAKKLDDTVPLYLGIPMRTYPDGSIKAIPGFDGSFGTIAGPQTKDVVLRMADGKIYNFDNGEGTHINRDQFNFKFEKNLDGGWRVDNSLRYSSTDTTRNGVFPNALYSVSTFLAGNVANLSRVPGATNLGLELVNQPGTKYVDPNGLMVVGGLRGLTIPVKEIVNDLRFSRQIELAGQKHDITAGYYIANFEQDYSRYSATVLLGAQSQAPLLDLVGYDANGKKLGVVTDKGIYRYGYEWANAKGKSETQAVYLLDEWQLNDKTRLDAGVRYEKVNVSGTTEQSKLVNLGTYATSSILTGNGVFDSYDKTFDKTGYTLGANYQFEKNSGIFGRWTQAFRMPNLSSFITSPTATPITQTMDLAEVGYKFRGNNFDLYSTLFYTKYNNVAYTNYVFSLNNSTSTAQTGYANTKTTGLELEGKAYFTDWSDLGFTATVQDPQYDNLIYTDKVNNLPVVRNFKGNQLIRVPKVSYRLVPGLNLLEGKLRLQLAYEFQDARFVDAANSVRLPSYTLLNLSGRYQIDKQTSVFAYIDNVTNSQGLTEGNPRAGEIQSADALANTFVARPLLGRTVRLALKYDF